MSAARHCCGVCFTGFLLLQGGLKKGSDVLNPHNPLTIIVSNAYNAKVTFY